MAKTYNLYNLEAPFREYLIAGNQKAISIKNYLSDIRHFFGWFILFLKSKKIIAENDDVTKFINTEAIQAYKSYLNEEQSPYKTINRRLSTLRKFCSFCISQGWVIENEAKKIHNIGNVSPAQQNVASLSHKIDKSIFAGSDLLNFGLQRYIGLLGILIFVSVMGAGLYNQFFIHNRQSFAYPSTLAKVGRILSFQGRLTDTLNNPITSKTNVKFNLYNAPNDGLILYSTNTCSVTPDQEGFFSSQIGSSCGSEIPLSVFMENADVYLGITVAGDTEMTPRQQIANVGYSINSKTLQGLRPGSDSSMIPYINADGHLLIGAANSGIRSTSTSTDFTISSARATIIQSAGAGDVIVQATESGSLKFRTGGDTDASNQLVIDSNGEAKFSNTVTLSPTTSNIAGTCNITTAGKMYFDEIANQFYFCNGTSWNDLNGNTVTTGDKPSLTPQNFVYDGNIGNFKQSNTSFSLIGDSVNEFTSAIDGLFARLKTGYIETENAVVNQTMVAKNIVTDNLSALASRIQYLASSKIDVSEKITSPVVESEDIIATGTAKLNKIQTNEIKSQNGDLALNLSGETPPLNENVDAGKLAKLIIKGLEGKTVTTIDASGNASFSGQVIADSLTIKNDATVAGILNAKEVKSDNITAIQNLLDQTASDSSKLSTSINDIQGLLADIQNQPLPNLANQTNLTNLITDNLTVTGNANLYNASISNSLLVGTTFIDQNSIVSLASELKLSSLSTVNLFDGAVIITKDGKITTSGEVIAQNGIRTNEIKPLTNDGQVSINNLTIDNLTINNISTNSAIIAASDNFTQNGIFAPAIETATASAGLGILPENSSEVVIYNSHISPSSLIYLTPTSSSPINTQLTVVQKEITGKQYFKVAIDSPVNQDIKFNWLIVN